MFYRVSTVFVKPLSQTAADGVSVRRWSLPLNPRFPHFIPATSPESAYSRSVNFSPQNNSTQRIPLSSHLTGFMALAAANNSVAVHETFAKFLRLYE
jgi:hypothetical protein